MRGGAAAAQARAARARARTIGFMDHPKKEGSSSFLKKRTKKLLLS
jgi:hypothetical protein